MPTEPIKFGPGQENGWSELAEAQRIAMNVVIDGKGCVRRRPCLQATSLAPSTVIDSAGLGGIFAGVSGDIFVVGDAPTNRQIYRVLPTQALALDTGSDSSKRLNGTYRPVFAETQALVVIAGGDDLQKVVLDGYVSSRVSGGVPDATHVIANSSRLGTNRVDDFRGRFYYSGTGSGSSYTGHEQWGGTGNSGFTSAEGRPDPIVAVHENTNEVFLFGSTTLQVMATDPGNIYAPVVTTEAGCGAPYSVIKVDSEFAWLDDRKRLVMGNGRRLDALSPPIQQELDAIDVTDCFGYRVQIGSYDCLVWTFPTDGRSFVYQLGGGWSQWSGYSDANAWDRLNVNCHCRVPGTATNLVGTRDGRVAEFSTAALTDLGSLVNSAVVTGFMSRGTLARKWCKRVKVLLKRGETTSSTTAPVAWLTYRDRPGAWEGRIPLSLGVSAERDVMIEETSLGYYHSRQWGFEYSGTEDLQLAGVLEEFEVLGV